MDESGTTASNETPPPGVGTISKTKDGNIFDALRLPPDTLDPREPKGK